MADRFTAGPLSVMRAAGPDREGEVGILNDQRCVVAECWADIRHKGEQALDEAMANATLYAHAPEMVKALRALVDRDLAYMDHHVVGGLISGADVHAARDVLRRATESAS
jgi:hypothetical protein